MSSAETEFVYVVPGTTRYYCRAAGCGCYSACNVPYWYCDRHLALYLTNEPITDKPGWPPPQWDQGVDDQGEPGNMGLL